MPRSTRTALLAVVLLGLAALLLTLWPRPPAASLGGASPDAAAPSSSGAEGAVPEAGRADGGSAGAERDLPAVEPGPAWARVFVEGQLRGGGIELEHTVVIVRPGPLTPASRGAAAALAGWTKPDLAGRFRLELSHCFAREFERFPSALNVQVSTDGRMPFERDVAVTFGRAELELGGELVVRAEVELPTRCSLSGTVRSADGTALAIQLAVFESSAGRPIGDALALGACDGDGRFELAIECDTELVLLAFADGWRPASRVAVAGGGWIGELLLERGAELAGRLVQGEQPLAATLVLRPAHGQSELGPLLAHLARFDIVAGRLEWSSLSARSDSDGFFRLAGLAPGNYHAEITPDHERSQLRFQRAVSAPDPALVIDLGLAQVLLEVFRDQQRAENEALDVELTEPGAAPERQRITAGLNGLCALPLPARAHVRVFALDGRLLGELQAGAAGTVEYLRVAL